MPRLKRGQIDHAKLLPLDTCHDIRSWCACVHCKRIGSTTTMIETSKGHFWHGRCFIKRFGMERLLETPRKQLVKLTLGDLGVEWMKKLANNFEPTHPGWDDDPI